MQRVLNELDMDPSRASAAFDEWLLAHPSLRTLAVFSPLPGEVNLSASVRNRPDIDWLYPRVCGESLTFHHGNLFVSGAFGILEPTYNSPEVPIVQIDAFICPGLAFERNGSRLGRGRGFYDRTLVHSRKDALKVGVCFERQIVSNTFAENHDIPMDVVIF